MHIKKYGDLCTMYTCRREEKRYMRALTDYPLLDDKTQYLRKHVFIAESTADEQD